MARFKLDKDFLWKQRADPEYQAALVSVAQPAKEMAKAFAPIRTDAYRQSIRVVTDERDIRLEATDWKAHWIEFGTVDTPVFAPLRRGVRAAGLKLREAKRTK